MNLIKKFKKQNPQKDPVTNPKPNSKNDLISSDPILLNEIIKGNIYSSDEVIIEKEGEITGHIHSKSCIVNGKVDGDILCSEYIEVKNTAIIEGNVKAGSIEIEAGSIINGFISIDKKIKLPVIAKKIEDAGTIAPPEIPAESAYLEKSAQTVKNIPPKEKELTRNQEKLIDLLPAPDKPLPQTITRTDQVKETQPKTNNNPNSDDSWW